MQDIDSSLYSLLSDDAKNTINNEPNWTALQNEISRTCPDQEHSNEAFIHYLKVAALNYQLRLMNENSTYFILSLHAARSALNDIVTASSLLIEALKDPGYKGEHPIDEQWLEKLHALKLYSEISLSHYKVSKIPKGAKIKYSKHSLANTYSHLWRALYPEHQLSKSYPIAEAFFIAAGYTPKDIRGDSTPSNIGKTLKDADRLRETSPASTKHLLEPYFILAKKT